MELTYDSGGVVNTSSRTAGFNRIAEGGGTAASLLLGETSDGCGVVFLTVSSWQPISNDNVKPTPTNNLIFLKTIM
jgi:hypothetical protein